VVCCACGVCVRACVYTLCCAWCVVRGMLRVCMLCWSWLVKEEGWGNAGRCVILGENVPGRRIEAKWSAGGGGRGVGVYFTGGKVACVYMGS
jgi:hypothetical protein